MKIHSFWSCIAIMLCTVTLHSQKLSKNRIYHLKASDIKIKFMVPFDSLTKTEKKNVWKTIAPLLNKYSEKPIEKKVENQSYKYTDSVLVDSAFVRSSTWAHKENPYWHRKRKFYIKINDDGTLGPTPKIPKRLRNQKRYSILPGDSLTRVDDIIAKKMDTSKRGFFKVLQNKKWPVIKEELLKKNDYLIEIDAFKHEWFSFNEFGFNTIVIPVKYRTKKVDVPIGDMDGFQTMRIEEFTTNVNLNAFIGFSYGNTKFERLSKGKEINQTTWKLTWGLIVGFTTIKLDASNTNQAKADGIEIPSDINRTIGAVSLGTGITYTYEKFNLGVFVGLDHARGQSREQWDYQNRAWVGLGVGYSLFKL